MRLTFFLIAIYCEHLNAATQTDTLKLSSPYDSLAIEKTTISEWIVRDSLPFNNNGESQQSIFGASGMTTWYNYASDYARKGYRLSFSSKNENLKNERLLNTITFFNTSRVILNGAIKLNIANCELIRKTFGQPLEEGQPINIAKYVMRYQLMFNGTECEIVFVFRLDFILDAVLICDLHQTSDNSITYYISHQPFEK